MGCEGRGKERGCGRKSYRFRLSAFRCLDVELDAFAAGVAFCDLGVELELHALLLQDLLCLLRDLGVHSGPADLAEEFYNRDF